ncbi:DNA-3-methyladenine glycosylase [Neorhodopirellula lusitana]|uniref:Putative 3-methyladenine DNA glycosylase n=1 Tax=Neorhodopirellula lusitana TaxID=445327 RepID=A0ABY1PTZ6_9BACT|nr:DNA-3-methyladenine glycosylase [Neorhodopirellula lusitana]SMP45907.1 DNA-3-methyladenine glycosylase [Neorhodopirellula lusitana]
MRTPLPASFFDRSPARVARELIGCSIQHRLTTPNGSVWVGGVIVETEAYLSTNDPASHSHGGATTVSGKPRRNQSMFGPPGSLYVYTIHAKHCVNFVTEPEGIGSAVLIRALQPAFGVETMQALRGTENRQRLTSGPGMLCQALGVQMESDGINPLSDSDWNVASLFQFSDDAITTTSRIGISSATDLPLRYFLDGNRFVSGRARDHHRPRRDSLSIGSSQTF